MKQRMKQTSTRLMHAVGNSSGSIMLTTLVLMLAVTVVAVGLNTSILTTAEDTYDQYYETQSYYTARSVATAIAEEIAAQSVTGFSEELAASSSYASADEVNTNNYPLLTALQTLRDGTATEVTLDNISFDSTNFVEGTGDYIDAKITKQDDTTYLLTVTCEISGISDSVSIALSVTENEILISTSGSSIVESIGTLSGFYFDGIPASVTDDDMSMDYTGSFIVSRLPITLFGSDIVSSCSLYCEEMIALAGKVKYEKSSAEIVANDNILINGSDITVDQPDMYADGSVTISGKADIKSEIWATGSITFSGGEAKLSEGSTHSSTNISNIPEVPTRCRPEWVDIAITQVNSGNYSTLGTSTSLSGKNIYVVNSSMTYTSNFASSLTDSNPVIIVVKDGCTLTVDNKTTIGCYFYLQGSAKLVLKSSGSYGRIYSDAPDESLMITMAATIEGYLTSNSSNLSGQASNITAVYTSNLASLSTVTLSGTFTGTITSMIHPDTSDSVIFKYQAISSSAYYTMTSIAPGDTGLSYTSGSGSSSIAYYYTYDVYQYVKG